MCYRFETRLFQFVAMRINLEDTIWWLGIELHGIVMESSSHPVSCADTIGTAQVLFSKDHYTSLCVIHTPFCLSMRHDARSSSGTGGPTDVTLIVVVIITVVVLNKELAIQVTTKRLRGSVIEPNQLLS